MGFGSQLRDLRRAAGLTQEDLAERSGLTANGISAIERGTRSRPYPHTVRALADALQLDDLQKELLWTAARASTAVESDADPDPGFPLAAPMTKLVGRAADLARLESLLLDEGNRLITLTGPGGVGKSRLAVEGARRRQNEFRGGSL